LSYVAAAAGPARGPGVRRREQVEAVGEPAPGTSAIMLPPTHAPRASASACRAAAAAGVASRAAAAHASCA
jgi:hypothetical protein